MITENEYYQYVGKYVIDASKCEDLVFLLLHVANPQKYPVQEEWFSLGHKIVELEKLLNPKYTSYIDNTRDLIKELKSVKDQRNIFAHGVPVISEGVIHLTVIDNVYPESGAWGAKPKYFYQKSELDKFKTELDDLNTYLLCIYWKATRLEYLKARRGLIN